MYLSYQTYRVDAIGLKNSSYTFQITISVHMWNMGQFQWKFDILSITAWSKFESKNPFAHMWHI